MCEPELQDMDGETPDYSGENDRRKEPRRVQKDRREMIRYEVKKEDRRSGEDRRKVKNVSNDEEAEVEDEIIEDDETVLDSVIGKITNLFGR